MSISNIFLALDLPGNFGGRAQMKNKNPFLKKEVSNVRSNLRFFPRFFFYVFLRVFFPRHALRAPKPLTLKTMRAQADSSLRKIYFVPSTSPGAYQKGHLGHPGMSLASDCKLCRTVNQQEKKEGKRGKKK